LLAIVSALTMRLERSMPLAKRALRCVAPELLGMKKVVREDAARRAFAAVDEDESAIWLRRHLDHCTAPLLAEPWILDVDTTVKPPEEAGAAPSHVQDIPRRSPPTTCRASVIQ
jgi:hypothetical protein